MRLCYTANKAPISGIPVDHIEPGDYMHAQRSGRFSRIWVVVLIALSTLLQPAGGTAVLPGGVCVRPGSTDLYAAGESLANSTAAGAVCNLDLAPSSLEQPLGIGAAWGAEVLVADSRSGEVVLLNASSGDVVSRWAGLGFPFDAKRHPHSPQWVAVADVRSRCVKFVADPEFASPSAEVPEPYCTPETPTGLAFEEPAISSVPALLAVSDASKEAPAVHLLYLAEPGRNHTTQVRLNSSKLEVPIGLAFLPQETAQIKGFAQVMSSRLAVADWGGDRVLVFEVVSGSAGGSRKVLASRLVHLFVRPEGAGPVGLVFFSGAALLVAEKQLATVTVLNLTSITENTILGNPSSLRHLEYQPEHTNSTCGLHLSALWGVAYSQVRVNQCGGKILRLCNNVGSAMQKLSRCHG